MVGTPWFVKVRTLDPTWLRIDCMAMLREYSDDGPEEGMLSVIVCALKEPS